MQIDPWILTFSALTVLVTIWMGFWSAKKSKTASDFFVAGRSVSVGWNASAISGEYLSAASFMGVAGMVMSSGYDALWYPVCYACGYLFLLLFIAGPLRRFGAYTIPDFAEGRFDSPLFRKIAVVFVLFIGFFYTMPQMKGAGTTLAYIFPGLPYWAGVVLVGAVITLNVALGGMKGITLVQAFQYWAKMFAISVPVFVLMAVYGHYGKQVEINIPEKLTSDFPPMLAGSVDSPRMYKKRLTIPEAVYEYAQLTGRKPLYSGSPMLDRIDRLLRGRLSRYGLLRGPSLPTNQIEFISHLASLPAAEASNAYGIKMSLAPVSRSSQVAVFGNAPSGAVARALNEHHEHYVLATRAERAFDIWKELNRLDVELVQVGNQYLSARTREHRRREPLPAKAPSDETWLNPFGPLTTKAAKAAAQTVKTNVTLMSEVSLPPKLATNSGVFKFGNASTEQVLDIYAALTGWTLLPRKSPVVDKLDEILGGQLTRMHLRQQRSLPFASISAQSDKPVTAVELKTVIENGLATNGISLVAVDSNHFRAVKTAELKIYEADLARNGQQAWLDKHQRPLALLYTYSLIIALVCGTAGLPHILVRFYTNPDGVAAKRTTMWVMILIGVFYLFPPVFGVMGRNLMPDLYNGLAAVKGTDGIVLKLPKLLNERVPMLGSILSGITCAGAFAAFMSTFSGLLVSMTGAMAHDVYGRIFRPNATQEQRLLAFKVAAVGLGAGAILLGFFVESFEINKMVGWAFAIAATSYFPLLFLSTWWRGITMKGAATGMLVGGTLSLVAIASTMFADQAAWAAGLKDYYAAHPLLRILAEQPAIWALPLAMGLMFFISKLTANDVPADIRMKMLVLHAPEKLGLKQEYIQEHQQGH